MGQLVLSLSLSGTYILSLSPALSLSLSGTLSLSLSPSGNLSASSAHLAQIAIAPPRSSTLKPDYQTSRLRAKGKSTQPLYHDTTSRASRLTPTSQQTLTPPPNSAPSPTRVEQASTDDFQLPTISTNRYIHFYPSQQNVYRGQNYTNASPSPLNTPLGQHPPTFAPPSPPPLPFGPRAASSSDQDSSTDDERPELRKQQGRRRRGKKETVTARRRLEKERAEGGQQGQKRATPREVNEVHEHSCMWEGQRTQQQHQQQRQQERDQPVDSHDDTGRFAARHHESTPDIIKPCPSFRSQTGLPDDPSLSDEAPTSHYHNRLVDDLAPLAASSDYVAIVYRQVSLVADMMKGDAGSHDIRAFNAALDEVAARYPAMPDGRYGMREFLGAFRVPLPGNWY